jgi:mRNA interferase MazF
MAKFIKGDVVVVPFPFSDLTGTKKRPAFVLANLPGNDIILCQITSQYKKDPLAIEIPHAEFSTGGPPVLSYVRPNRVFTADKNMILRKAGSLKPGTAAQIIQQLIDILNS